MCVRAEDSGNNGIGVDDSGVERKVTFTKASNDAPLPLAWSRHAYRLDQ